jgi:hypothetical protein
MSDKQALVFDRPFQVWAYSVSHSQLLLRSPSDKEHRTRVDLLFKNVTAMLLRETYARLHVRAAHAGEETLAIRTLCGIDRGEHRTYYVIEGEPLSFVVAASVGSVEDEGSYSDPSSLFVTSGL